MNTSVTDLVVENNFPATVAFSFNMLTCAELKLITTLKLSYKLAAELPPRYASDSLRSNNKMLPFSRLELELKIKYLMPCQKVTSLSCIL
jgi:hypothetical protein